MALYSGMSIPTVATQEQMEAGTGTHVVSVSPLLVKQAIDSNGLDAASQVEAEAGTESELRAFSPLRIAQAIAALGASVLKMQEIAIDADFDNTEQSTGFTLPSKCMVLDVILDVTTGHSGQTLNVGTDGSASNDLDGYLDAVPVTNTGLTSGAFTVTSGGNNIYVDSVSTFTKGALLRGPTIQGQNVVNGGDGAVSWAPDLSSGGDEITYSGSAVTNTMRGRIIILYVDLT